MLCIWLINQICCPKRRSDHIYRNFRSCLLFSVECTQKAVYGPTFGALTFPSSHPGQEVRSWWWRSIWECSYAEYSGLGQVTKLFLPYCSKFQMALGSIFGYILSNSCFFWILWRTNNRHKLSTRYTAAVFLWFWMPLDMVKVLGRRLRHMQRFLAVGKDCWSSRSLQSLSLIYCFHLDD